MAGVKRTRGVEINNETRSWAFVLFKDYVAANGDKILKSLLPAGAPTIVPQFVITDNIDDFRKKFMSAIGSGNPFLWRLEAVMEGGTGHHLLISVNPKLKRISILDPAVSEQSASLYSADKERVQIQTIAKEVKYTVSDAPLPFACQPIVEESVEYLDTSCQTWSILLAVDSVVDDKLSKFQFKSPTTKKNLDERVNILKAGIERIVPMLPTGSKYQIQGSVSSAEFEKLGPIKKLYTDDFIIENMKSIVLPENQHELVSDYSGYKKWGARRKTYRKKYLSRHKTHKKSTY